MSDPVVEVEENSEPVKLTIGNLSLSDVEKAELVSRLRVIFSNCNLSLHENDLEVALHNGVDRSSVELALSDQIIRIKFNREHADLRRILYTQLMQ